MKCFHFPTSEPDQPKPLQTKTLSSLSKLSWARSASTSGRSSRRSRDFDIYSSTEDSSSSSAASASTSSSSSLIKNRLRVFGFGELKTATRGFCRAHLIGEGGFGCVYRGVVRGDTDRGDVHVAVKQLNRHGPQGHKEWINEVNLLGVIRHPNLVKLVGYCAEDDERGIQRLLVYELMKNKSLEDHLFPTTTTSSSTTLACLPWMSRLKIAQDAARGLAHLHEEMDFKLIFRDFKTSNVLLDEEFNAKLSDFGLARLGPPEGLGHVSTVVVGTVGYAAPEYVQTGRLMLKSDVWSFGVVLYELITGRRAVERNLPRGEQKLLEWVRPYASDPKKFHLILDPRLKGQYCIKSAQKVASLANKCLTKHPKARPKMSEVVEILGSIINGASALDGVPSHTVCSAQEVEGETNQEPEPPVVEDPKLGGNQKKVFDIKELVNLRNRSIGKLDWRNLTLGLIRGGSLDIFGIGD